MILDRRLGVIIFLEKLVAALIMPAGLLWLVLMLLAALAWRRGQRPLAAALVTVWLVFTLAGNTYVSAALCHWLERPYLEIAPLEQEPFDAVVVLGGGVGPGPRDQAQLDWSGDRVMLGARLYLTGRASELVTTGSRIDGLSAGAADPHEYTLRTWQDLQIPAKRIHQLPGRNTREEMASIRDFVEEQDWQRVGLVTSAWHLRRAMRLSEKAGLTLEPLPADHRSVFPPWTPIRLIPDEEAFYKTRGALKEMLGMAVGM